MDDAVPSREEIRALLAEHLELEPEQIGFDDDLVELGLHSMRMIKIAAGWRAEGFDVNFGDLAQRPSIDEWHQLIGSRDTRSDGRSPGPEPVADGVPFGLATMQHGYWIGRADGQELGGVAAHLYAEFDGEGLEVQRLERAVAKVVRRHGMLRSQFLDDGTQRVLDRPALPVWSFTDLRTLPEAEVQHRLADIRDEKTHQRMPAEAGKVFDVSLTLLPGGRTRLHVDVDMLAADALSYRVLIADLAEFYRRDGEDLEPLAYDYRTYLAARAGAPTEPIERARSWWRDEIPRLPDPPRLPLVPERERTDPLRSVRYDHWLDDQAKRRLIDRAHRHGVTPAVVLAAIFAECVGRWSGERRFLLNLPLFNREPLHPQIDMLVGDFSSSVLIDVETSQDESIVDRARALQRTLHQKVAHAEYPGLDVLRDLGRLRGEPVLASVVYTSGLNLGELFRDVVLETFGDPVWIISQGPQVVLDAQVVELKGGLLLNWDVREHAFPPGLMDAMFARHHATIDALVADDADWTAPLSDALPADQAEVRRRVNDTAVPESGRLLHTGFFAHAQSTPEATAMVWAGGELDYGGLRDRALRVAAALVDRGVRSGDAVAIHLPKGPDQVVAALGVLAAGATYVPVGVDQPEARRTRMLQIAGVKLVIVDDSGPEVELPPDHLGIVAARTFADRLPGPVDADTEDIAYLLFTSGSTGEPKGVEVPHAAAVNTVDRINEHFAVGAEDRALALSALEFDLSVYDMFGMFSAGGSLVTIDEVDRRDGHRCAALIRDHGVTLLNCAPGLLDMILTAGVVDGLGQTLRTVVLGGDWVGVDLPRRLRDLVPGCRFAGLGGTTETAIHSTICEVDEVVPADWRAVPYGRPMGNVRCRVVDELGRDCPDWVPGELWIGGRGVARGYRGDPERTADRFVEHAGTRWYRTGDLARYRPDGTIEFLGRRDHQVKIRGHRVELGEVEAALRELPGVGQAIAEVVGERRRLVAAVTLTEEYASPDGTPEVSGDEAGVIGPPAELADILPAHMIPERLHVMPSFPLTSNGKLDRKSVARTLHAGAERKQEQVAPASELEAVIADIMAATLGVPSVGVTDDFFALGGDSVLATNVIARIRDWLDTTEASVTDLFANPTVRELAVRLIARQSTPGRIEAAARIYLEVAAMSDQEVLAEAEGGQ
ncbi:amino acid adenylation domain-containing protein [Saccharothrix saharensis]|uniref:non-ribosomal peptide synthetase n=1 Tax=Saccharothrix saharensis TaxID=571190 RepID=UPI0036B41A6A